MFIQAYRKAAKHSLLRQDITFTRQDFYEANFMSFSVLLSNRGFQDQEGFHSLQHLPETYGFHPPRTEILQLLLSLDWTAGQGSQLQPQHKSANRVL